MKLDREHRRSKYLNNRIECGHGNTEGFEVSRMFRKRQFDGWLDGAAYGREACVIGKIFDIFTPI